MASIPPLNLTLNQTPVSGTGTTTAGGSTTGAFFSRTDPIPRADDLNLNASIGGNVSNPLLLVGAAGVLLLMFLRGR